MPAYPSLAIDKGKQQLTIQHKMHGYVVNELLKKLGLTNSFLAERF